MYVFRRIIRVLVSGAPCLVRIGTALLTNLIVWICQYRVQHSRAKWAKWAKHQFAGTARADQFRAAPRYTIHVDTLPGTRIHASTPASFLSCAQLFGGNPYLHRFERSIEPTAVRERPNQRLCALVHGGKQ